MVFTDDEDDLLEQWCKEEESNDDDLVVVVFVHANVEERGRMKVRHGSEPGRQVVPRDVHVGNMHIMANYFVDPLVYNDKFF